MDIDKTFRYPTALTIAGSDSGGGAGIQADIKTFSALGVFGASAITSVTAQNTQGVRGIQAVSPEILQGQIEAVFDDFVVDAVKIGMLHNKEAVGIVAAALRRFTPCGCILDPVMISTSGAMLLHEDAIGRIVNELFPLATLVTPNIDEARYLSGLAISNEADMAKAAQRLLEMGCQAVLMKGGHLPGNEIADLLYIGSNAPIRFATPVVETNNSHGTGCTLSSAIAAYLALRKELPEAVGLAKEYITSALVAGSDVRTGHGHGPANHFFAPTPLIKIKSKA